MYPEELARLYLTQRLQGAVRQIQGQTDEEFDKAWVGQILFCAVNLARTYYPNETPDNLYNLLCEKGEEAI